MEVDLTTLELRIFYPMIWVDFTPLKTERFLPAFCVTIKSEQVSQRFQRAAHGQPNPLANMDIKHGRSDILEAQPLTEGPVQTLSGSGVV